MALAVCHVFGAVFCVYCHVIGQERLRQEQMGGGWAWSEGDSLLGRLRSTRVGGWVLSDWLSQTLPKYPTHWLTNLRRLTPRYWVHPTDLINLLPCLPLCCADKPTCPSGPTESLPRSVL